MDEVSPSRPTYQPLVEMVSPTTAHHVDEDASVAAQEAVRPPAAAAAYVAADVVPVVTDRPGRDPRKNTKRRRLFGTPEAANTPLATYLPKSPSPPPRISTQQPSARQQQPRSTAMPSTSQQHRQPSASNMPNGRETPGAHPLNFFFKDSAINLELPEGMELCVTGPAAVQLRNNELHVTGLVRISTRPTQWTLDVHVHYFMDLYIELAICQTNSHTTFSITLGFWTLLIIPGLTLLQWLANHVTTHL